jgi:hypothetical protein
MFGGLRVEQVATSVQKPSNVAVYVAVSKGDDPALGLTEKNFHILEDGTELSPEQTQQVLLPRDVAAVHRALLLVDMSGPVTEGDTRHQIAMAAARFASRAHTAEPVTIYAFDGGASIRLIAEIPEGDSDVVEIPQLESYAPTDTSSNLNSAIVESLAQLDARLMTAQKPLRIAKMSEALDESKHLVFAISIKDVPGFYASRVGRTGSFEAESPASLLHAFDEAGARVADTVKRYYLLSYCSPARAGQRSVRLRVVTTDEEGKELSGSVTTDVDATGFTSGCDPQSRPRFVARGEPDAAPHAEEPQPAEPESHPAPTAKDKDKEKDKPGKASSGKAPTAPAGDDEGDSVVPPPAKPGYAQ